MNLKKYDSIAATLFIFNRKNYVSHIKPNSLAVFHSADLMPRVGDGTHKFRQNSDLFYLTGIDQEESILLLCPHSPIAKYREVLFIRQTNDVIAVWEGRKYTIEEARKQSGIETVLWNSQFEQTLDMLMNHIEHIYINLKANTKPLWLF